MELRLLQAITRELGAATDVVAALRLVMARVCRAARWPVGQAWIPRADGTALEWGAAAGDDGPGVERFLQVSRGRVFGPGEGLPGACWQLQRPVWMKSLADVAAFPRAAAAAAAGLTAGLAAPVLAGGEVVAVVEFFVAEAREEDERALGLVQTIATQLGWLVQRRRSEDALRDSEQRFRQLAETINEVFWLADPPCTEMLYVSPAYEEIFGRSCASLYRSPRSWADAVHPEDRERIRAWYLAKRTGEPVDETYRIVRPDGSVRWIRDRGYPVRDAAGNVYRFAGVAQDVTDCKRAERERERRVGQLQALANAAQAIGAAASLDEIAAVVTDGARRIIGARWSATSVAAGEGGGPPLRHAIGPGSDPGQAAGHDFAGILQVPLIGRDGKRLGLIRIADKVEGAFGEDDTAILLQLARVASEAIENTCLLREVTASRERLETLSRRLVHLQEVERRNIARELHDHIGQLLTGLKFMLEAGERHRRAADPKAATAVVAQLLERVADLSLNLRPPMLDELGLVPTLRWHFQTYQAQTGVRVRFDDGGFSARLPADAEITAFRIIQEALTNVARHANVTWADVDLWAEDGWLGLRVEDGGRGFEPAAVSRASSGLTGMAERARLLGGSLAIESRPGAGTRLLVRLPAAAIGGERDRDQAVSAGGATGISPPAARPGRRAPPPPPPGARGPRAPRRDAP
jgi:PAS domain S-box-containing protein